MIKKLLQLNVTANWGSTGKIAEGIGLAAMKCGWESYIAYGRYMNPSQSNLIKVGNQIDVYAHYARHRILDEEGLGSKVPTKRLIKQIDSIKPDIIHLHNIHDHWLNYPLLFDYLASIRTPIVWTFHDCWAFTGGCPYFEMPYCDKWKSGCGHCPIRKSRNDKTHFHYELRKKLISKFGNRLTLVPVSHWLEKYSIESFLGNSNIQMIHNGIDCNTFRITQCPDKKCLILGVANVWDSRKGLDDIVKIRQLLPINEIEIFLVGLSHQQLKNLPKGINGCGRTQNINELVELYNRASILINPTYADNFPTVNLEALACGTPVITYQTGGSPEAVNKDTGIVVERGNYESMANSILHILKNPNDFLSINCRERALLNFNQISQFKKYIDLYNSLLIKELTSNKASKEHIIKTNNGEPYS